MVIRYKSHTVMPETIRKRKELFQTSVLSNTEITTNVHAITLEKQFDFIPGQVVAIAMHRNDEPRLYSIASGSQHPFLRIFFDINPIGELTPLLADCKTGDTVYVSKPFGKFIDTSDEAWWIATGTGIAPFVSMAESGLFENKVLLQGARLLKQFYYSDLFSKTMNKNYLRFCTGENADGVITGRLTEYLRNHNNISPKIKYYLCGSAEMVVEVRDILISKGVPYEQIIAEIYF